MSLSDFMKNSKYREGVDKIGYVDIVLSNGKTSTLTVNECVSEFYAKERVYLFLVDKIYNK